jgi:serine phosphatase RsbU (regulator of sigma subunit)
VWQQRLQQERIERERVDQELRVARRIQQASLPNEVPELEGWQISPVYQPASKKRNLPNALLLVQNFATALTA